MKVPTPPVSSTRGLTGHRVVSLGCVLLCVGYASYEPWANGAPLRAVLATQAYVVLAVVAPGTIVHRALRGPQLSLLADLSFGAVTGLCLELFAWAACQLLHLPGLLRWWPLLTLFLVVLPRHRRRLLSAPTGRLPTSAVVAVAAAVLLLTRHLTRYFFWYAPLPPSGSALYPDLLWHLGIASEATRAFPLHTPQVETSGFLRYHWFSAAHLAAESMISGVDLPTVLLRLWIIPVAVLTVLLAAALAHALSGHAWAGGLAAWLAVPAMVYEFWSGFGMRSEHFNGLSPSQIFAMPIALLLASAVADLLRQGDTLGPGSYILAGLAALSATGAKASSMPTVLGGLVITLFVAILLRQRVRFVLVLTAIAAVVTAGALLAVSGSDAGSRGQLLASFALLKPYRALVGTGGSSGGLILDGLVGRPGVGPVLLVALTLMVLLLYIRQLAFLVPILQPRLRRDLAAWYLAGSCVAAWIPLLLLRHPGFSQIYFILGVTPLGSVLWAWGLADLVGDSPVRARVTALTVAVAGGLAGVGYAVSGASSGPAGTTAWVHALDGFVVDVVIGVLVLAGVALGAYLLARRHRSWAMPVATAILLAPVIVAAPAQDLIGPTDAALRAPKPSTPAVVAETEAAAWIRGHLPMDALTATNSHCVSRQTYPCDGRQWWLSGLGGRRALIEGWGFTPEWEASQTVDTSLLRANQAAFSAPTPQRIAFLREKGVSWLVAVRLPGLTVSPDLGSYADKRYDNGTVAVYELPR